MRSVQEFERAGPSLRSILDNTTAVVYVKDLEFRYLFINQQFERLFKVDRESVVGKTDYDIFPSELAREFQRNDRQVLQSREVLKCEEVAPHDDGPHTYITCKLPLVDQNNELYGVAGISQDITERVRAEEELELFSQQMELILNSMREGIFGVDKSGTITFCNPAACRTLSWSMQRLIGKPLHVVLPMDADPKQANTPLECPILEVLSDGEPRHVSHASFWRQDGTRIPVRYSCAPLVVGEQARGAVVTFHDLSGEIRQREFEREMQTAEAVQRLLYPSQEPRIDGFDIAGAAYPADQTCGDYFDFIPLDDGRLAIVVGDVSGHGLGPALHMVETRAYLRALLSSGCSPLHTIQQLNRLLEGDLPEGSFVSMFLGLLDADSRHLEYASAGHPACLMTPDGSPQMLEITGTVLGLLPQISIHLNRALRLEPGSTLLIPTDGLMETLSAENELFGWQRTIELVRSKRPLESRELIKELYAASRAFRNGARQRDDITMVIIRTEDTNDR